MAIKVAKFRDVADGLQPGQFAVGDRDKVASLQDIDPMYKQLMDKPYACVMSVIGPDGRPGLTPMWFDYEGDKVLVNVASQRSKTNWIRKNPEITIIIVNPENMYHWMSMKVTVEREILEDDPTEGSRVTEQLNRIWNASRWAKRLTRISTRCRAGSVSASPSPSHSSTVPSWSSSTSPPWASTRRRATT
jgi:nitroimidazol reductase NimA-like FMN-containing flavoprotein (pyridoxamine 5'-phosphate oxidase superfamily)